MLVSSPRTSRSPTTFLVQMVYLKLRLKTSTSLLLCLQISLALTGVINPDSITTGNQLINLQLQRETYVPFAAAITPSRVLSADALLFNKQMSLPLPIVRTRVRNIVWAESSGFMPCKLYRHGIQLLKPSPPLFYSMAIDLTCIAVTTSQTLEGIDAQIAQNQVDLPVAVAANQQAGTGEAVQGLAAVNALLGVSVTTKASPVQTLSVENVGVNAAGAATTTLATQAGAGAKASSTAAAKKGKNGGNGAGANAAGISKDGSKRILSKWAKRMVVKESA